ncbi:MAG: amidohydrolase [Lachnospiraceae bacterium]|nr:amidohydrolase [Lachnospiraceae bacterium]
MLTKKDIIYIEETAQSLQETAVSHRRALHRIPETAWHEEMTTAYLKKELERLGYRIITGSAAAGHSTGLVAEIGSNDELKIGLRFDIDALSVTESNSDSHKPAAESFLSEKENCMHACGHDGHMAIGLLTARILAAYKHRIQGTVRLLFQPAEEGCMGAVEMVRCGWLSDLNYFMAAHIVGREYGQTASGPADCVSAVTGSLATTKINVYFNGKSCHGACPEHGASAISALSNAVLSLNGIPRSSEGSTMINIGRISGGEGRNVVAGHAEMELEVRGNTTALNQYMEDQALRIVSSAAAVYGCTAESFITGKAPSLVSSPEFHSHINAVLKQCSGIKTAVSGECFRASEDAALMMEEVKKHGGQAAFLLFPTDTTAPLHSRNYDFDEGILGKGAAVFSLIVLDLLLS